MHWLRRVFALSALIATPCAAQMQGAEWERTIEAANKEGSLVMFSQPNQAAREFIAKEWAKVFPKIDLSISAIPEAQFQARFRTERAAGKYLWDVAVAGSNTGYFFAHEGTVVPVLDLILDPQTRRPEMWGGWDQAFVDVDGKNVFAMSGFVGSPWFNALNVPPDKVGRLGLRLMLEPEYQGKIVWQDPSGPGAGRAYGPLLRTRLGDDNLRKLVVDQKTVFVKDQHFVVEAIARGTAWIGIGPPVRSLIAPFTQAGIKTDVRPFGKGPDAAIISIGGSALYAFDKMPHPNATRLFVTWILSRDIQHGLAKATGQRSRREDVPETAEPDETPIKGAKYLMSQREADLEYLNATGKFVDEIRKSAER
jgi:ABC-type glycerol-3-phosphate transport system substrate-binding protein